MRSEIITLRHHFEHRVLPYRFFLEKAAFIERICAEGELFRIYAAECEKEGVENPYNEKEFSVTKKRVTRDLSLVTLTLPHTDEPSLCVRILMIYDTDFTHCGYYTVERGMDEHWMGGWDAEVHFIYTPLVDYIADEEDEEISRALYTFGTQYPDYCEEIEEVRREAAFC